MADCGKHFKCVGTNSWTGLTNTIALGILSGALTIIAIVAAVIAGAAIPGLGVVAGVLFVAAIFELCAYLHGGKLICIEDGACTIGRLMKNHPVGSDKSGFEEMDDDFTMDILPSPHSPRETLVEMTGSDTAQGRFLLPQPASSNHGLGYAGVSIQCEGIPHETEVFHVEVKGCRVHDVCNVLKAMSFGAPVVGFVCSIPVIGWIACAIVAAVWLAITAAAVAIAWASTHVGHINDVYDPAAGTLEPADRFGNGGDVILVRGDWVYDEGHDGWNEIHPIKVVLKLTDVVDARFRGMDKADTNLVDEFRKEVLEPWCFRVGQAADPLVRDAQQDAINRWYIHPVIDGCTREPVVN
jgi:hypothetical protein